AVIAHLDHLQSNGEKKPAVDHFGEAKDVLAGIWIDGPVDVEEARDRLEVANTLGEIASRLSGQKDHDKASLVYRSAAGVGGVAASAYPDDAKLNFRHGQLLRLVGAQRRPIGHPEAAERANDEALASLTSLLEKHPRDAAYLLEMAELRRQRGLRRQRQGPTAV